jgi:potassium-transporting ATPase ATP-binding subunit
LWLWAAVLFANFAEAVAEGRGKAQADTLRRSRQETVAFVQRADGGVDEIPSAKLQVGDLCVVKAGQVIPGDDDVVAGLATVDESAITGESAPVIRESGGDRSAVTGSNWRAVPGGEVHVVRRAGYQAMSLDRVPASER